MWKSTLVGLSIAALTMNGCSTSSANYEMLQTKSNAKVNNIKTTAASIEYRILPQDRLQIMLYKDPNQESMAGSNELGESMSKNGILVNAAGYITLPLIGKVKVSGLTQTQAADKITKMYKKYLNTPSVYLEVLNKRIFVLGEVNKPGVIPLDKEKMTLFEAIAHAGDVTDYGQKNKITVVSNIPGHGMQMRTVDITDFDHMKYADLMLRPNDIVYVRPDSWKQYKVASDEFTAPFETITKIASPFVTIKYLSDD
jgi:polysaccharide export outer membrane protein